MHEVHAFRGWLVALMSLARAAECSDEPGQESQRVARARALPRAAWNSARWRNFFCGGMQKRLGGVGAAGAWHEGREGGRQRQTKRQSTYVRTYVRTHVHNIMYITYITKHYI